MVYVYTPEVYPTRIRGMSMGVMTSAARIGALVTPFIAQVRDLVLVAMKCTKVPGTLARTYANKHVCIFN